MRSTRRSRPSTFPALARQQCPYGNSHWRLPEGLVESDAALRAPWKRPRPTRVAGGATQAGSLTRLLGSLPDRAACPSCPRRPTRGAVRPALPHEDANARRMGGRDRVFPESQAREAAARLQEGSVAIIPDCGHMPHVECPDRFLAALDEFLGGQT